MPTYLGFDSSTQGLTAIAIEASSTSRQVLFSRTLNFDAALPAYGTRHGVLPSDDPRVAVSPPLMWAEALDTMFATIAHESGIDRARIRALAGSAQQHGSVYLTAAARARLGSLDPAQPLAPQIRTIFSRGVSPIWMDASTAAQCAAITAALGGPAAVASLTGSRTFERFTGPQIRKYFETDPDGYERTARIHMISSFLASVLVGSDAPLDPGDASGMNLMDIRTKRWAPAALDATAPGLDSKLPPIAPSSAIVGTLAPYWTARYGLPAAKVVAWSGDNPCSLIGVGLVREGRIAISLGTSDTVFGFMPDPRVDGSGTGHVFGSPTGDYMGLTCFMNGSLAREKVRDAHGFDWARFSDALRRTPAGNGGAILLPWFAPEITPCVTTPGLRRYGLDAADAAANVRAVVEAQMIAMARHSRWMGVAIRTIHATGGAAANRDILQVMADVFNAEVYQLEVANSACLGAALRAYHADALSGGRSMPWDEVVEGFVSPIRESRIAPNPRNVATYAELTRVHAACEAHALGAGPDPTPLIDAFRSAHRAAV
jgi:xylulokinase